MKSDIRRTPQFLIYNAPQGGIKVEVTVKDETVWVTQKAMAELFGVQIPAISKHLKNIFEEGELDEEVVISILETTTLHGALVDKTQTSETKFYNLDAIISVGYRVNSRQATQFRQWATRTLREYIQKGFVLDDERLKQGQEFLGKDYFFMPKDVFLARVGWGEFLEHAEVHGNHYGTLKSNVYDAFAAGKSILMDIDVAGAEQIRDFVMTLPEGDVLRDGFVDVFIMPPSLEELRRRLVTRGEDASETIELRMKNAIAEMAAAPKYRHTLVNDILDDTYRHFKQILQEN